MTKGIWIALLPMICTGCGSVINRPVVLDSQPPTSISLDGKQRMIVVVDHGPTWDKRRAICAEPSPDALTGIAATIAASANVEGKVSADVAGSLAEAVQTVGRRTQTIQLLRDGLYRACEAYLNGALSEKEYKLLLSRVDDFAITILAIDGLTGGLNVPATSLRPTTSGETSGKSKSTSAGGSPMDASKVAATDAVTPAATDTSNDQSKGSGTKSAASGGDAPPSAVNLQVSADIANVVKDIVLAFYKQHLDLNDSDLKAAEALGTKEQAAAQMEIDALNKQLEKLKQEVAEQQALLRSTQAKSK